MGPSDLVDLSGKPTPDAETDTKDHGLRFTNEDWNGSIANSHAFTLRWNESITDDQGALRLFRILYPEDGVMSFEPVSNLTGKQVCLAMTPDVIGHIPSLAGSPC